ncbi:flagellin [Aliarcobacter cryaerophilus]|uniref:Flagellin n=1 Tax=Aliarcobacter cryaerophilus TaxID=28198 RepID=A0A2S9T6S0_9BACT|nr:flagellin [Aliarcobacter cryaerophilus]PRM94489.1 flagellin [Aliarcobacter cryaerophilus]
MRINTNVSSLGAQEAAQNTNKAISSALEKLSTGLRINSAADDASGLAIADKLRTQVSSINQGIKNGNSAVSLLTIADKAMNEQSKILDTIKTKLIDANTASTSDTGREAIRKEVGKLLEQLDNIASQTNYNGRSLLADVKDGKLTGKDTDSLTFQIGERNTDMIQTAQINATTANLGGGEQIMSKVKAGESAKLSNVEGGTLEVTGKSAAVNVTASGNLGKLSTTGTVILTVDPEDTNLMAKLKDIGNLTQGSGASKNQFTLTNNTADLRAINFDSVKITNAAANNGQFKVTETGGFDIKNNELGSTNDLTITAAQDIKKGETSVIANSNTSQSLTVTGTAGLNTIITGNLGSFNSNVASVIEATNSKDIAALQKLVDDGVTGIERGSGNKFNLTAGAKDLGSIDFVDAKLTTAGGGNFTTTNTKDKISITNNSDTKIIVTNMDAKSASNLESLKNLQEGELTREVAADFQAVVNDSLDQLNGYRGDIGSTINQVNSAVRNLMTQSTNVKAAEAVIREVDYAEESANFNKLNILSQAGSYAISQANATQQNVLRLLQ